MKSSEPQREILIIAGEPSGDRHAADLVIALKEQMPTVRFFGIGGDRMQEAGVTLLYHIRQMAFLGLAEVIRHLPFIRRVLRHLRQWLTSHKPLAVILVDYPGFNLKMAKIAHELGIPVIYYISPQLWAWGERRVEKMRRYVDLLLVLFRFEEEFYAQRGITAHFVGHPLVDQLRGINGREEFLARHGLSPDKPIIALLPGSRLNEVQALLPIMLGAKVQFPRWEEYHWVIGKSDTVPEDVYRKFVGQGRGVTLLSGETHSLMKHAHLALVASGTATLETAFLGTPIIVLYKVAPLTYHIARHLVKIDRIALANIVLGKKVVPELIQREASVANVVRWLNRFLTDESYYQQVKQELAAVPELLGPPGASRRAAEKIVHFLERI